MTHRDTGSKLGGAGGGVVVGLRRHHRPKTDTANLTVSM
jgi:hypothetical protein